MRGSSKPKGGGPSRPQAPLKLQGTPPYLGSGTVSITSKEFGIKGNLEVSQTINTSTIKTSTIILYDAVRPTTKNNFYLENSVLKLNGNRIVASTDPDLTVNTLHADAVYTNDLNISTVITDSLTINNPLNSFDFYVSSLNTLINRTTYLNTTIFIAPNETTKARVSLWGAGGGFYGNGAYVEGDLNIIPGQLITVIIGKGGEYASTINTGTGGQASASNATGSGGGFSAIFGSNFAVIAGGGGSASHSVINDSSYSHAGILNGYPGDGANPGGGGTQSNGGIEGDNDSRAGINYTKYLVSSIGGYTSSINAGAGGAGYYGGGGGGANSGGGGGSSYISDITNVIAIDGTSSFTYSMIPMYQSNVALGGTYEDSVPLYFPSGDGLVTIAYYPTELVIQSKNTKDTTFINSITTNSIMPSTITFMNDYNQYDIQLTTRQPVTTVVNTTQTFTVPLGVKKIRVGVWGAGGGYYGNGAYVEGDLEVTPGETLTLLVGSGGIATDDDNGANGDSSGGGDSDVLLQGGAGGGTYSAILNSNGVPLVIAGAGGAASYNCTSGDYSHAGIDEGYPGDGGNEAGQGGTQDSSGLGGKISNDLKADPGFPGYKHVGGGGGNSKDGNGGGGGGDGYYGGGGGAGDSFTATGGGGGGGSSYVTLLKNLVTIDGSTPSEFQAISGYQDGAALGGTYSGTITANQAPIAATTGGGNGLIKVLYYEVDLTMSTTDSNSRVITNNILVKSTILDSISFNIPRPFQIFTNYTPSQRFVSLGTNQTIVIPQGVTKMFVKIWGAGGVNGGNGAFVSGYLTVTPGETLQIIVGDNEGYGGGGEGYNDNNGGGRSAIVSVNDPLVDLVTAGGGGGGVYNNRGGNAGIYNGYPGYSFINNGGGGGTQKYGGLLGYGGLPPDSATSGEQYQGGNSATAGGGGGGGGYYGGGGGGHYVFGPFIFNGGGGGGSCFIDNLTDAICYDGSQSAQYMVDPEYQDNAGLANNNGLVVISYAVNLNMQYTDPKTSIIITQAPFKTAGWVACGGDGSSETTNSLVWSIDGSNWNNINSGGFTDGATNNYAQGVHYNGDLWVAVGPGTSANSTIQTSTDGINWSPSVSGGFILGKGVTYGNGLWVAVGSNLADASTIQISKDGLSWTGIKDGGFSGEGNAIAINTEGLFVAGGTGAPDTLQYSSDGSNWDYEGTGFSEVTYGVATDGINWVAVGNNGDSTTIKNSSNGSNWTDVVGGFAGQGNGVAYGNGLWIAVGDTGTTPLQTIQWSTDSITWNNAVTGGFRYYGSGIAFNGKYWIVTGYTDNANNNIQYSLDGSNWTGSVDLVIFPIGNASYGPILQTETEKYTSLTNNAVITTNINAINVNTTTVNTTTLNVSDGLLDTITINDATVSSISISEINSGDFYTYSLVKYFAANPDGFIVALGTGGSTETSIQWGLDGSNWYDIISGGFSPSIIHTPSNVINYSQPKGLLYNPDNSLFFAYGITNEYLVSGDPTNVIQFSANITDWSGYTYSNISNAIPSNTYSGTFFISEQVLNSINSVAYFPSNGGNLGTYLLLTSSTDPVWTSTEPGSFSPTSTLTALSTLSGGQGGPGWNGLPLLAAYGSLKVGTDFYITGTASPGGCPIYKCSSGNGMTFSSITSQVLPPTVYSMAVDSNSSPHVFFIAGPGIIQNTSTISTVMCSTDSGLTWNDTNISSLLEANSVTYGYNPDNTGHLSNQVVVTGKANSIKHTILLCAYANEFSLNKFYTSTSNGFSSVTDLNGNIVPTYTGTATFFNPNSLTFLVGGLTNDPLTCVKQNTSGGNIWDDSGSLSFNGVTEKQFVDSINRSIVTNTAIAQTITTTNMSAGNIVASNIEVSTLTASVINNNTISNYSIHTSSIIGSNIQTINLNATNINASFLTGNGSTITNVTAYGLVPNISYNIGTGVFFGDGSGLTNITVSPTGTQSSALINANKLIVVSENTYDGSINAQGSITTTTGFFGNGANITNVTATALTNANTYNIGTGSITASNFICSDLHATSINADFITTSEIHVGNGGIISDGGFTVNGNLIINGNNTYVINIDGTNAIFSGQTTSGSFLGNGSGLTGTATGLTAGNATTANTATTATNASNAYSCSGNSATATNATNAYSCSGNSATATNATNAYSCSGNSATATNATYAAYATGGRFNASIQIICGGDITSKGQNVGYDGILCDGGITSKGQMKAPAFIVQSDKRIKSNIVQIDSALHKINKLQGVQYTLNNIPDTSTICIGLIAQDVEKVIPEVVHTESTAEKMKGISYTSIIPVLIEGIKDLSKQVTDLQAENAALKKTIDEHSKQLAKLMEFMNKN